MNHRIPRCIAACLLASACAAQATELVYTPVNPAFGGNPLNGTWLLNNAQAQNDYDDPDLKDRASAFTGTTALERFSNQLESRMLSQLLTTSVTAAPAAWRPMRFSSTSSTIPGP